jgi:hypothetical protein
MSFFNKHPTEVTPDRVFSVAPHEIRLLNPNTGNCPTFITRADADLTLAIYRRFPVFIREHDPNGNPWGVSFLRMFDMSNDSGLFHQKHELDVITDDGWKLSTADGDYVPLYEAKLLWHYDHRLSSYALRAAGSRDTELPRLTDAMHDDPHIEAGPRYWIKERHVAERVSKRWDREWLLGWRDITGPAVTRTLVPAALPLAGTGNSFFLALPDDPSKAFILQATLSSLACDFVARQKLTGVHMTYFVIKQLALPHPESFSQPAAWQPELTLADWIRPYVLELSYTSHRLRPYAEELGDDGPTFRWLSERRTVLQAELDGAFMHIYGLQRHEVEHVLGTFRTLRGHEEKLHGEYRTQRLVLDAYDRMAAAARGEGRWSSLTTPAAGSGPRHVGS